VYLDPPYAPPRDDNDYIKRYHFLEGLCSYWAGLQVMEDTVTRKLPKRFTPFAYPRTIREALRSLLHRFRRSVIVLSYGSNSVPGVEELEQLLRAEKREVRVIAIPHRYSFGTHAGARRRLAEEYLLVGR
jgi:DNA adenine methylase/adenine-specific DNA-methyltransferase